MNPSTSENCLYYQYWSHWPQYPYGYQQFDYLQPSHTSSMNADQAEVALNDGFQLQLDHVRGVSFTFVLVKSALTYSNATYLSCSLVSLENPSELTVYGFRE